MHMCLPLAVMVNETVFFSWKALRGYMSTDKKKEGTKS